MLGERAFDEAWAAGARLTLVEAIAEVEQVSPPGDVAERAPHASEITLSPREHEILRLLVAGRSDREMADLLYLSVRTVEAGVGGVGDRALFHQPAEIAPPGRQQAALAGGLGAGREIRQIGGQVGLAGIAQAHAALREGVGAVGKIAAIGGQRGAREAVFQPQRVAEVIQIGACGGVELALDAASGAQRRTSP